LLPVACAAGASSAAAEPVASPVNTWTELRWAQGLENQRKADLGDGTFLNPIMPGDHPDPTIVKDGDDYYMTFSSFDAYPGLTIWHSRDLVNWQPLTAALTRPIGSVWAPELTRYRDRYYLYIPARTDDYRSIWVIHADDIRGPWSEPVDLELHEHIDPGHVVGEDGKRYLFLSQGDLVPLSDDGLRTTGPVEHVYDAWQYPEDWTVECACPEGPKVVRRGDWFYLITAVGGTAGPPTGHMVITARSRSVRGPWEDAPNNLQVRTRQALEKWWSRGHATLVEGPGGGWWLVYHGYENGYRTLGRQTLLDPVRWTDDGWFEATGGDLSRPLPMPPGEAVPHGMALSDDFSQGELGRQWAFYRPDADEMQRVQLEDGALVLQAKGTTPADSSPLTFVTGDLAYSVEVEMEIEPGAQGGLLLFYNDRLYAGLGVNRDHFVMHRYGLERNMEKPDDLDNRVLIRIENDRHIVTIHTSADGKHWRKFPVQMETSGYHHNVAYDFLSLRPALYAAGAGEVHFIDLKYEAL
jgi:xylan 1,4-beta-xylosidase